MNDNSISHIKKMENQGKQGVVGIVEIENNQYIYKISQFMNYTSKHEYLIMKGLEEIRNCCPHFCKPLEFRPVFLHPDFINFETNPFKPEYNSIELEVLFVEYITGSVSLTSLIEDKNIPDNILLSIIKQIIIAIIISQKLLKFVHYDLHSMNILIKKCDPDQVSVYYLNDNTIFYVPTFGYVPVIIDYGYASSIDLLNKNCCTSMAFTDAGYMAPYFDPIADIKVFLISLSGDFKELRPKSDISRKLENITLNLFKSLDVDWHTGWDNQRDQPIMDDIFEYIENPNEESRLFRKYYHFCCDLFQHTIVLPFKPKVELDLKSLKKYYRLFVAEFQKIEQQVGNSFYSLYFLYCFINISIQFKDEYMDMSSRVYAITNIKNTFLDCLDRTIHFCNPSVNFDLLVCTLFLMSEQIETQIYYKMKKKIQKKFKDYDELTLNNIEQYYAVIDINFPIDYEFTENTKCVFYDCINKNNKVLTFDENDLEEINLTNNKYKAFLLNEINETK